MPEEDAESRCYYITFNSFPEIPNGQNFHWRIKHTVNNMDTASGLLAEIKSFDAEMGCPVHITWFKELKEEGDVG